MVLYYHGKGIVKIHNPPFFRFVVLIPHRDSQRVLGDYRRRLFAAGFDGAWSFPAMAPLALVSRPCDPGELKTLAYSLRNLTLSEGGDGSIGAGPGAMVECPGGSGASGRSFSLWGLSLRARLPLDAGPFIPPEALVRPFPAPVLCAALLYPAEEESFAGNPVMGLPSAPVFSFRAASVANLIWRPLRPENRTGDSWGFSALWETGKARWLPSC